MTDRDETPATGDALSRLMMVGVRTNARRLALLDAWAERNGLTRSAAADELLGTALRLDDTALATLPEVAAGLDEVRTALASLQVQFMRAEALLGAVGELAAIAPLLLAHWHSTELGVRAADETPEQAEERTWDLWSTAGRVEWDARRRRVAPTSEETALELGEEGGDTDEAVADPVAGERADVVLAPESEDRPVSESDPADAPAVAGEPADASDDADDFFAL